MRIDSNRRYRFAAGRPALWAAVNELDAYQRWWPWLREFDGEAMREGSCWSCVVRPPLPYVVRFQVRIDHVEPERRVEATIDGDVMGTATLELHDGPGGRGSEAHLRSSLAPENRALHAIAVLARPLVRFGHDWVLDTGAEQFSRAFAGNGRA